MSDLASSSGQFVSGEYSYTSSQESSHYTLYMPTIDVDADQRPSLVVMLHGCTQNAEDFAVGTQMHECVSGLIQSPCFVLYIEQNHAANTGLCWNWYLPEHQQKDQGEPAIIAGLTQHIMEMHNIDPNCVYLAGLSAGGGMAAIMGAQYPDLYAAIGICAGLPYQAAHDLESAMRAMSEGAETVITVDKTPPLIVFHGKQDHTVNVINAQLLINQYAYASVTPTVTVNQGLPALTEGHSYEQSIFTNDEDQTVAELWIIEDADHAWPGGSKEGSYTDPAGPDASREMLRFFNSFAPKPE